MNNSKQKLQGYFLGAIATAFGAISMAASYSPTKFAEFAVDSQTLIAVSLGIAIVSMMLSLVKIFESKGHSGWFALIGLSMAFPPAGVLIAVVATLVPDKKPMAADALKQAKSSPYSFSKTGVEQSFTPNLRALAASPAHDPWSESQDVKDDIRKQQRDRQEMFKPGIVTQTAATSKLKW